jgi:hypothetical protein
MENTVPETKDVKEVVDGTLLDKAVEEVAERSGRADRSVALRVTTRMKQQMDRGGRRSAYLQSQRDALRLLETLGLPRNSRPLYVAVTNRYFTLLKKELEKAGGTISTKKIGWDVVRV